MIKIELNVTYDKALTAGEEERIRESIRSMMIHFIATQACKVQLDSGDFVRSQYLNVDGSARVV